MAILAFQKPDKVIMLEGTETVGRFEFRPLEPGYGQTIGNALRRILLASLEGFAISQIKVGGVQEEFQTIPGVIEGMQDIILNLKQVRFRRMVDTVDTETASITISGKSEFTAEDISKGLSSFKVLNPELHICSLEPSVKLEITLTITKGRGFVPAEEMRDENTPIGTIPVDAIYTPIWTVENFRVEQKTDYEKLLLEIVTDGSISPEAALQDAANILIYHFKLFTDDKKISLENAVESDSKELDEESLRMRPQCPRLQLPEGRRHRHLRRPCVLQPRRAHEVPQLRPQVPERNRPARREDEALVRNGCHQVQYRT